MYFFTFSYSQTPPKKASTKKATFPFGMYIINKFLDFFNILFMALKAPISRLGQLRVVTLFGLPLRVKGGFQCIGALVLASITY